MARAQGIGMARRSLHPHASVLFVDFMLTDAQELMAQRNIFQSSRKVKSLIADMPLKFLDPAKTLNESEKWNKYYREIVVSRVR